MNILDSRVTMVLLKIYAAIALAAATLLSPLAYSIVPGLLLVGYLYLWRWPLNTVISLLTEYFIFFAVTLLLSPGIGPVPAAVAALPVLLLINHRLQAAAASPRFQENGHKRWPTGLCVTLLSIAVTVLGAAFMFGSMPLLLASAVVFVCFAVLGVVVWRGLPVKPVEEKRIYERIVAGSKATLDIELSVHTAFGGLLFLKSPYDWLKVSPEILPLKSARLSTSVTLSPDLSGPSIIRLKGYASDRWGLMQVSFDLEPVELFVIPRARYAAWLAEKYLAQTRTGTLPLISNMEALNPQYGLRSGVEYYGSQVYQPGDSLRSIDWKHSYMHNELISKEFTEFRGQSAVVLINLAAGNAEEADKLAYNIIITAMSLAQDNIPSALAAYDNEAVRLTTPTLQSADLLLRALKLAQEIVTPPNPVRYLNPPDITRLRADISRIGSTDSQAARVLGELLQIEYTNLNNTSRLHPATKALNEVLGKADRQSNIVIISMRNHDAEALAFNTYYFSRHGRAVITV